MSDGSGYWPYAIVVTITPADEWDRQTEDMAQDAAMRYPGITFTMACKCDRDDDRHDYGCGQTFETSAYNGATYSTDAPKPCAVHDFGTNDTECRACGSLIFGIGGYAD